MSDSDKMRAEFEQWAKQRDFSLAKYSKDFRYISALTGFGWEVFQSAYAAGRKAEREEMQREREEWSKAVNKAWIETANTRDGQL